MIFIDLPRLCRFAGTRFIHSKAHGIDLKRKQVVIGLNASTLSADVASINVGGTSFMSGVAGAQVWAIPSKPVPDLLDGWARVEAAAHTRPSLSFVVVGGGAGGVELTLAMHSRLRNNAKFTIVDAGPHLLPGHHPRAADCRPASFGSQGYRAHRMPRGGSHAGQRAPLIMEKGLLRTLSFGSHKPSRPHGWLKADWTQRTKASFE